ncbi:MAG: hypothetical protein DMG05_04080 [Acidobacteria bacterium]|nr:MAG: hypothetical protein DMG05_04080 [Acidobacteriota bacterium]
MPPLRGSRRFKAALGRLTPRPCWKLVEIRRSMESCGVIGAGLAGVLFSMTAPTGLGAYVTLLRQNEPLERNVHPSRDRHRAALK